jgi:hypothetical protein
MVRKYVKFFKKGIGMYIILSNKSYDLVMYLSSKKYSSKKLVEFGPTITFGSAPCAKKNGMSISEPVSEVTPLGTKLCNTEQEARKMGRGDME